MGAGQSIAGVVVLADRGHIPLGPGILDGPQVLAAHRLEGGLQHGSGIRLLGGSGR